MKIISVAYIVIHCGFCCRNDGSQSAVWFQRVSLKMTAAALSDVPQPWGSALQHPLVTSANKTLTPCVLLPVCLLSDAPYTIVEGVRPESIPHNGRGFQYGVKLGSAYRKPRPFMRGGFLAFFLLTQHISAMHSAALHAVHS